ncbi:Ppx/GppA phosphatase family protein [Pacificimonas flava]|uniref:Exopolyphosphatase n=1 Tax=Pacificimonas flava TaxID=1234595 RepID=M2TKK1_9SPHN|nr:Ppx/GppA phosphatase family protein [Pacificimonas flava]EMD82196.1 Exopolyphosphatase [Pacificimonas flava]MBB5280326.1 exopolyphosphatase/guanosine-5'-triphosphate,3'-diphosphate pyrophosphatase [Pacificimonas flava]
MATSAAPRPATRSRAKHIPNGRRVYGAIDLGTNNCRLLIARPTRGGFYVIDAFSRIVRLGEGLLDTGRISQTSMDRAVEALSVCAEKLQRRDVWVTRNVATEACRRAANGPEFIERVFEETGIALDVITPAEEAQLAVLGCQALFRDEYDYALVFDIGGGSTEISLVECEGKRAVRQLGWNSVPWGVVSLTETELGRGEEEDTLEARIAAYHRMRRRVVENLERAKPMLTPPGGSFDRMQLLGTSGTITTLTSLHLGLPSYDRSQVDGAWVESGAMRAIASSLASMSFEERGEQPCIGRERATMIVAGCAILDAILGAFPVPNLCVADRGIREGILRTLMQRDGHR